MSSPDGERARAAGAVVIAALLFGSTFIVMRDSVDVASPSAFLSARFGIGAVALLTFAWRRGPMPRGVISPALITGSALLLGYILQTVGLQYTETSTSAFITYLLVVLVPVFTALHHRQLPGGRIALAVLVTTAGLWLLTGGAASIGRGEVLTLGCAAAFAFHVLFIGFWAPRFDVSWFMGLQLLWVSAACLVPGLAQGGFDFGAEAWRGAIYTGIGASAIALALQAYGQQVLPPTRTALLLMIEPVSAALIGYGAGERLSVAGLLGGALILAGVVLAESGDHPQKPNEYKAEWTTNEPLQGGTT
ncbi:MAG TPA: DMT family transporter [Acidimicrobiales bacterium]|nr:DMT family transporter [Acidimicrobiales bacterium]